MSLLKFSYFLYISLFIFTPVCNGTVSTRPEAAMVIVAFGASIFYFSHAARDRAPVFQTPGLLPLSCLLLYMLVQLIPLPPAIVKYVSPASYHLYHDTIGIFEPNWWFPISVNVRASVSEFFRYACYTAVYVMTIQFLSNGDIFKKTIRTIIYFIAIYSTLSLFQWLIIQRFPTPLSGTYVNRNHYAGLMEMTLPILLAAFLYYRPLVSYSSWREKIVDMLSFREQTPYLFYGGAFILGAISLFFTMSRGGITSFTISMIFFLTMIPAKKMAAQKRFLFGMAIILFIVFLVGNAAWDAILNRFLNSVDPNGHLTSGRPVYWADSLKIIRDSFLTGTGFGSYSTIIKGYNSLNIIWPPAHAHNDYLEFMTQGGMVGAILLLWFFFSYFKHTIPQFRKRKDRFGILFFLSSMAGLLAIFLHSFTDFNMRLGANALYFFFLLGLGVSSAFTSFKIDRKNTSLQVISTGMKKRWLIPLWVFGIAAVAYGSCAIIAYSHIPLANDLYLKETLSKEDGLRINAAMKRAVCFDPLDAYYRFACAKSAGIMGNAKEADTYFRQAIYLYPSMSSHLHDFAAFLAKSGDPEKADLLFNAGIRHGRFNPKNYMRYADFLWANGDRNGYAENIRHALTLQPDLLKKIFPGLLEKFPDQEELFHLLPDRVYPYQFVGDHLVKMNKPDAAEKAYLKSLDFISHETGEKTRYVIKVSDFFARMKRYEEALGIIDKGLIDTPGDVTLRLKSAFYYEKLGITYRAMEEYKKVLTIDPYNRIAQKKLTE